MTHTFWIYAVILEQDGDRRHLIRLSNWHLIILWMYTCHLLRSTYTSSLYTYMSKDRDPTDIPESFNCLIYKTKLNLLVDYKTESEFIYARNSIADKKSNLSKLWNKTAKMMWSRRNGISDILTLVNPKTAKNEISLCQASIDVNFVPPEVINWKAQCYIGIMNNWLSDAHKKLCNQMYGSFFVNNKKNSKIWNSK